MTLVIDCTTAHRYVGHSAVGIVRVEREITRYALTSTDAVFVVYDHNSREYKELTRDMVEEVLKDDKEAGASLPPVWKLPRFRFRRKHFLIIAGLPWDNNQLSTVYAKKQRRQFKVGIVLYDIIPVVMPEYCVPEMNSKFTRFVLDLAHTADEVFCISEHTARDFKAFLGNLDMDAPKTSIFRLGSDTWGDGDLEGVDFLPENPNGYIVYVSSIEPRKNHPLLFNVWRELHDARGDDIPTLLCVGKQQWNVENFMVSVQLSDVHRKGLFKTVQNLTDAQLAAVYRNANFTVYPSLYEGWGLPIVESMTYGKAALISDRSSMPEAGAGICPMLDPYDHASWKAAIENWIDNPAALSAVEQTVQDKFSFFSWDDAARTLVEGLE
ncbi:glycosyltransferase family 4 protein [Pseudooctadecabacter jejudonensis]|uniref:D-inositol-3-phosphate glycosyltransferase n=1 Tax=Pseudooctadecabacter jejudonensis TaxID=1391910 RepID=A0A1Y5TJW4_9RHOB|nr:glycosyltransferase family 1 protein [Pseudooctadecabacter jejudonensis]SLN62154.1 D-inositol-3-phosphate glycosyltransferase [Pseudooctadecabacter jejudonensis]